jgi:hypothetical protein
MLAKKGEQKGRGRSRIALDFRGEIDLPIIFCAPENSANRRCHDTFGDAA